MDKNFSRFGIKPRIDTSKSLNDIEKDLIRYKKTKQWKDDDQLTRYTNIKILSKDTIWNILQDSEVNGIALYKIAK